MLNNMKRFLLIIVGFYLITLTAPTFSKDKMIIAPTISKSEYFNSVSVEDKILLESAIKKLNKNTSNLKSSTGYLNLSASAVNNSIIRVSWNGNNSKIKWKNKNGGSWNGPFDVNSNPAGSTSSNIWYYDMTNLQCNTEYKIKVKWRGRGWRKTFASTNSCGSSACPQGGWFDGANCQIGKAPSDTTAFIYSGNYYYTPNSGNQCSYTGSHYDGANCFVQAIPNGVSPFIYLNHWYYKAYP